MKIILTKEDLVDLKKKLKSNEITLHDFKRDVLPLDLIYKAHTICFIDDDKSIHLLKSRD